MPWRSHSHGHRYARLSRRDLLELLIAQEEASAGREQNHAWGAEPLGAHANNAHTESHEAGERARLTLDELYTQLEDEKTRETFAHILRNTLGVLVTVAAVAVLVATLVMPVLQITGNSMAPTVSEGQYVLSLKGGAVPEQGDIIAFYYNNKILVKRVIAGPGDWVNIDKYGNVSVNDKPLDEPYLYEKALGECDIELPYQVPDDRYFVMGDHRSTSVDSRSSTIGCVAEEQIVGTIVFRVWPLTEFGPLA